MVDSIPLCFFNGCTNIALSSGKCSAHKTRVKCAVDMCHNQTYARSLCVKHGGKHKCIVNNCTANARSQGLCCKHGPKTHKTLCTVDGCTKVAHARHRCVRHGGGQTCKVDNCTAYSRSAGMCSRHNYMYKEDAVVEPTMGVSNLPSSDESDTTDDLVTLLKEISILHIDNVMVDAPCDATNMTMEFSREDCDWLACMMSSMAYEQLLAVSQ